jgi:hypothetical protein
MYNNFNWLPKGQMGVAAIIFLRKQETKAEHCVVREYFI